MKIIRLKAVMDLTGLGRSTIYKYSANGSFPRQISLSLGGISHCSGWLEGEVLGWIQARVDERDAL